MNATVGPDTMIVSIRAPSLSALHYSDSIDRTISPELARVSASRAGPVNFSPTAHTKHSWSPSFSRTVAAPSLCRTVPFAGRPLTWRRSTCPPCGSGRSTAHDALCRDGFHPKLSRGRIQRPVFGLEFDRFTLGWFACPFRRLTGLCAKPRPEGSGLSQTR